MAQSPDRERIIAGVSLGVIGVVLLSGLAGKVALVEQGVATHTSAIEQANASVRTEANWPPAPTAEITQGTLVSPQPEGVMLLNPHDYGIGVEFKVKATNGHTYTVKRIETGQYEIVSPKPKLLNIRYLQEDQIAAIVQ